MQTLTEAIWRLNPPGGLFDETVVMNCFPKESPAARHNLVYRASQAGEVAILRRGLYVLREPFRRDMLDPAVLVPLLYGPSYMSFESALRFHGLIPDVVQTVAAATSRRSRTFNTVLGHFSFYSVPCSTLLAGVRLLPFGNEGRSVTGMVASPARAVADVVYLRREVTWKDHGANFLEESMRIDLADLAKAIRPDELAATLDTFHNGRVRAYLERLATFLNSDKRKRGRVS